jgi:hypothetical protein
MKIRPVVADLFHADGRMDRKTDGHVEVNSRFSQFGERAQKRRTWTQTAQ